MHLRQTRQQQLGTIAALMVGQFCVGIATAQEQTSRGARGTAGFIASLDRAVSLTDQQRQAVEQILADRETASDSSEQRRSLVAALREARAAGDDARIKELRQAIAALRQQGQADREAVLDEIEQILTPEQLPKLAEFTAEQARRQASQTGQRERMKRVLASLPERVQMDDTQRVAFAQLVSDLELNAGSGRRDAGRALMRRLAEILTPEQQQIARTALREARRGDRGDARDATADQSGNDFTPSRETVRRSLRQLDLSRDQWQQLRALRNNRSASERNDRGAMREALQEILTEDQFAQFQELIARERPNPAAKR